MELYKSNIIDIVQVGIKSKLNEKFHAYQTYLELGKNLYKM